MSDGSGGVSGIGLRKELGGGFFDLDVYIESYQSMLTIHRDILPFLPQKERYDLYDQLSRSTKAIPRLIAEGHSKRHQNKGFQKYIDDAHAESNETIVSLFQVKDLYAKEKSREICLALAWDNFHKRSKTTLPRHP